MSFERIVPGSVLLATRAVMLNDLGPFPMFVKVNAGYRVEEPAEAAVSETYARPGSPVSFTQARGATEPPVLFTKTWNVTDSPAFASGRVATIAAVRLASTSRPKVTK